MADYVLSAKGTYDGSDFDSGVSGSQSKLNGFMEQAKSVGSKVKSAIGDGFVKAADVITSSVGSIGAAVGTLAIQGGIKRALNIEQAQYKLKQMGMDVEAIMANCSEAVDGTRFGLDAAATSASLLGTSGVAAGEDMTRALKASAGIATIAGGEMEDIASIFSKVATKGKLTGDELLQLNERGINATDALSKALGKSQEEVQDMVKKGQVDFKTFSDAMYSTFGDAASGANETFSGAMSNVRAALSRVGQKFASPTLDALRQVFVALIPAINAANTALTPLVDSFSSFISGVVPKLVSGIEMIQSKIQGLGDGGFTNLSMGAKAAAVAIGLLSLGSMGGLISQIPVVGTALGGLFGMLGKLATPVGTLANSFGGLSGILGGLSAPVLAVVALVGALVAAFVASMATNEQFRNTIMGLVGDIGSSLAPAFDSLAGLLPYLSGLFQSLMNIVQMLVPPILGIVAALAPLVSTLVGVLAPIIEAIIVAVSSAAELIIATLIPVIETVSSVIEAAATFIQGVINAALAVIEGDWQGAWEIVKNAATAAWEIIVNAFVGFGQSLSSNLMSALDNIKQIWGDKWNAVYQFLSSLFANMENAVNNAISAIQSVITSVVSAIQSWWNSTWNAILSTVSSIWNGITSTVSGAASSVQGAVSGLVGAVTGFFGNLASSVASTVSSMWSDAVSAFTNGASNVISTVSQLPAQIMGFFADAGSWLVSAGGNIVQGLIDGIKGAIGSAVAAAADLGNAAINAAKGALGIASPSKVFRDQVGKNIALGIAEGISKNTASATKSINNLCKKLKDKAMTATKSNNYSEVGSAVTEKFSTGVATYTAKANKAAANLTKKQVKANTKAVNASAKKQIAALDKNAKGYSKKKKEIEKKAKESIKSYTKKAEKVSASYANATEKSTAKVQASVESKMEALADTIQDKYDAIADLQESMRSKLVDFSALYDSEKGAESLNDLKNDLKAIEAYGENMTKLKGKVSEDLLAKVAEMSVADGKAYSDYLLGLSQNELAEYDKVYSQIVSKASSISEGFYADKVKAIQDEYSNSVNAIFSKAQSDFESAGKNALQGFVNGITKNSKKADKAVSNLATSLVKGFKKKLGIKSPSRVLRDQVGKFIPLGIAAGIDKAAKSATKSVMSMTGDIIEASESALGLSGREFASAYEAALNMGELEVSYNTDARINGASGTEDEVSALRMEVMSLHDSLGRIIAENAPVVTETERQAARRYRRAQYA